MRIEYLIEAIAEEFDKKALATQLIQLCERIHMEAGRSMEENNRYIYHIEILDRDEKGMKRSREIMTPEHLITRWDYRGEYATRILAFVVIAFFVGKWVGGAI